MAFFDEIAVFRHKFGLNGSFLHGGHNNIVVENLVNTFRMC